MKPLIFLLCLTSLALGFLVGKRAADNYYNAQPEEINCPAGHTCRWSETDLTAGTCLQNCGKGE
jgi:hypothetical protein